jgi:selenocysteine lyase/cysteine desulfurase
MNKRFEQARRQFSALRTKTFLDAACVSLAPRVATRAIRRFLDEAENCPSRSATQHHIAMDEAREAARWEAAKLINAHPDEVAIVESTTYGLNVAAHLIPFRPSDDVVLSDLEFLQVALPWYQQGIKIKPVHHHRGRIRIEDIAAAIDRRTKAVVISSVQWTNGFRCDLRRLSQLCRERRVYLVVDAIQHLGAIPFDVRETPVDFLACGGHKWLNAPFGAGALYVRREIMEKLRPFTSGYLSAVSPKGGWGEYFQTPTISPICDYQFIETAKKFEVGGTSNYPGAIGLGASLRMINELGPKAIEQHIYQLTDSLIEGLQTLKAKIITPTDRAHRSGIITFRFFTSHRKEAALVERLLDRKILVSLRYTSGVGGIRVSCHFFNAQEDIDRLLNALEAEMT